MYRLRKVTGKEKRFFGVCAGISKYINPEMDPVVIRLLWLILTIFAAPPMIILYLALAIVLKPEDYVLKDGETEPEISKD
jgi:phage shock protein PspC (stress-responsive transcriptional regulator)